MRNEPAFPESYGDPRNPGWTGGGMTLRDYFATKAMVGVLAHATLFEQKDIVISVYAYRMADAMIAEREKGETK